MSLVDVLCKLFSPFVDSEIPSQISSFCCCFTLIDKSFSPSFGFSKTMAFFLNRTTIGSHFRSHFQGTQNDALSLSRRQFHIAPGSREQALLAEDPSLNKYKSHRRSVRRLKRFGDILTVVVVAGCCYEIYVKTVTREEARKAKAAAEGSS